MTTNDIIFHDVEQGSDAWFELRRGMLTGSAFKELMSGESTKGYFGLIYKTIAEIITEEVEENYKSDAMQRGNDLEEDARILYEDIKGVIVREVGFVTNDLVFSDYVGISPDGMVEEDNGMIEIKCPMPKTHIGYLEKGVLPNEYKWQVQGQLLVTGSDYCDFMSYHPSIKPMIIRVYPDVKMHDELKMRMAKSINKIKELTIKYKI